MNINPKILEEDTFNLSHWPPPYFPKRGGKSAHRSMGYRLANAGLVNQKLEVCWLNGSWHTSREAIMRFAAAVSRAKAHAQASNHHDSLAKAVLASAGIRGGA